MIQCTLADAGRYATLSPRLKTLFDFLKTHDLRQMPLGRIEVDGDAVFRNNVECDLISHEEQKLEVHRRYIDVHIPLDRSEIIGWSPLSALGESEKPFDETADFALYPQLAQVYTNVTLGQCFFAFPEDAHAPVIGFGKLRKAICKVLI